MDAYLQDVGERVRAARIQKHMSQAQLAEMIGFTPQYVSHIEKGKQTMSITALAKISNVLEVSTDWLLRNNTSDALTITVDELRDLLSDCTPAERIGIMRVARETKKALHDRDRTI